MICLSFKSVQSEKIIRSDLKKKPPLCTHFLTQWGTVGQIYWHSGSNYNCSKGTVGQPKSTFAWPLIKLRLNTWKQTAVTKTLRTTTTFYVYVKENYCQDSYFTFGLFWAYHEFKTFKSIIMCNCLKIIHCLVATLLWVRRKS